MNAESGPNRACQILNKHWKQIINTFIQEVGRTSESVVFHLGTWRSIAFKTKNKYTNKQEARNEIATKKEMEWCYLKTDKLPMLWLCLSHQVTKQAKQCQETREGPSIYPSCWKKFTFSRKWDLKEINQLLWQRKACNN